MKKNFFQEIRCYYLYRCLYCLYRRLLLQIRYLLNMHILKYLYYCLLIKLLEAIEDYIILTMKTCIDATNLKIIYI